MTEESQEPGGEAPARQRARNRTPTERRANARKLTSKQLLCAYVDSHGLPVTDVAKIVGFSAPHVSALRAREDYRAEQAKWQALALAKLEPLLDGIRAEMAVFYADAMSMMRTEALRAEDSEGRPLWSVRIEAVKFLNASPVLKQMFPASALGTEDEDIAKAPPTVVIFQYNPDGSLAVQQHADIEVPAADVKELEP